MKYVKSDITTVDRGIIMHGVNCLHVMGAGAALAIRKKWPVVYERYMEMPKGKTMLGHTHLIRVDEDLYVANCYTQLNFGRENIKYADIDAVKKCVESCFNFANLMSLPLNTTKIASYRGGLSWDNEVKPVFEDLINKFPDVKIKVYYL